MQPIPVQIIVGQPIYPPARPPLWRVKHDREIGLLWRPNLPEVFPFSPSHFTPFSEAWQRRSFAMNTMDKQEWRAVYADDRAFTNNNGYESIDRPPRRDYINMRDLTAELPKVEALVCGGAVLTGVVSGDKLIVHTLDGRRPPPAQIEPWEMFHAVTVDGNGVPRRFPQGDGAPVLIPLLADPTRYPVLTFPLSKLQRWTAQQLPDPYRVYL